MGRRARRRSAERAPRPASSPTAATPATGSTGEAPPSRASRTEAKNAAARASLVPLAEGERPRPVTVAFFVVIVQAILNVVTYLAGVQLAGGGAPPLPPLLAYTFLLLVTAYGLWRARYWAVLGTQALLVLTILVLSLWLVTTTSVPVGAVIVALIVGAGLLFWYLVKAMARIQMPTTRR